MSLIWKPHPIDVYKEWHEKILNEAGEAGLSTWEIDFMESLGTQLEAGQNLSKGQAEKLEQIYTEKTS